MGTCNISLFIYKLRYSSDGHYHIEEWSMAEGKKNSFVDIEHEVLLRYDKIPVSTASN
jgi:hypothetical protein